MTHVLKPLCAVAIPLCLFAGTASAQTDTAEADAAETDDAVVDTLAADAPENGAVQTEFAADYFSVFAPRTALDMVGQIPGFSVQAGDTNRRGLGQGGANVLINGERITGKANVFDQLEQILSRNVVRIRVLDGASLSIPGLSGRVVDIETRASSFSGSWEWNPEFREGLQPNWTNGRVNISGETGDLAWSGFARDFSFHGGVAGLETRSTAEGTPFERRELDIDNYGNRPGVGGTLAWTPTPDQTLNINAEYALFNFARDVNGQRTALGERGENALTRFDFSEDERYFEMGADYERPAFGGTVKAIGYIERESSPTKSTFAIFDPVDGFQGASQFLQDADEAETILRGEYSLSPVEGQSWQLGVEGAFNSLDITQQVLSRDPGETAFTGDDPDKFSVSEDRYEATLTHSRPFGADWDVQASVGVELSELSQSRDGAAMVEPQSFVRPKGFVSATYKVDDKTRIRSKVEREVGQLNFFDFVASVDLVDNLGRDANPDLVPAQSWLGSVELDKDFGQGNTVKVEAYVALIEDIVDRIPVGTDGDAVGNLDAARRWGVDLSGTIKGERWGLPGVQLDGALEWRDSTVEDPLTGFDRRLSGDKKLAYNANLRHDIPGTDLAYGAFIERFIGASRFRSFTVDRNGNTGPLTGVFVEHKDVLGVKARLQLINTTAINEFGERTVFDGRRDGGVVLRREQAEYDFGTIVRFRFSGEF